MPRPRSCPRPALAGLLLPLVLATPGLADEHTVATPRGAEIDLLVDLPAGGGRAPALVIAPGQGYHMRLPLIEALAREATAAGLVAVRLDWHYRKVEGGRPSADLAAEVEDLQAALAFARAHARVDPERVLLAGKSLGTLVAYRAFRADPGLRALLLLTPVVTTHWSDAGERLEQARDVGEQSYPGLAETTRPVILTVGDRDPLGALPSVYALLARTRGNVRLLVFSGDHGLNVGDYRDPAFEAPNAANVGAAARANAHWMRVVQDGQGR